MVLLGRCGRCRRERPIRCRGLCAPCYSFLWAHHREELARYPGCPRPAAPPAPRTPRQAGRLGPEAVRAIRRDGRAQAAIAADYGLAQTTVSAIKRRALYRHIHDAAVS